MVRADARGGSPGRAAGGLAGIVRDEEATRAAAAAEAAAAEAAEAEVAAAAAAARGRRLRGEIPAGDRRNDRKNDREIREKLASREEGVVRERRRRALEGCPRAASRDD